LAKRAGSNGYAPSVYFAQSYRKPAINAFATLLGRLVKFEQQHAIRIAMLPAFYP
jgi:hypothetical protein